MERMRKIKKMQQPKAYMVHIFGQILIFFQAFASEIYIFQLSIWVLMLAEASHTDLCPLGGFIVKGQKKIILTMPTMKKKDIIQSSTYLLPLIGLCNSSDINPKLMNQKYTELETKEVVATKGKQTE